MPAMGPMPARKSPHPIFVTAVTLRVTLDARTTAEEAGRIAARLIQHMVDQGRYSGDTDVAAEPDEAGHVGGIEVQNVPVDVTRGEGIEQVVQCVREFMANSWRNNRG